MMNLEAIQVLLSGMEPDGVDCLTADHTYGHGNAIEVETGIFLYGLVRRLKPRNILETGTHWGYSSAWLALALADNCISLPADRGPGFVVTIDVNEYEKKPETLWGKLGLNNIFHVIGSSEDPETYTRMGPPGAFDFFYMDADHAAEAIVREFDGARHLLNPRRTLLAFHDTRLDVRMDAGISVILQKLNALRKQGQGWDNIQHFSMRNLRGFDMILLTNGEYGY